MIRAVLFDLDGTLIDTEKTYYRAWHHAAEMTDYQGDIDAARVFGRGHQVAVSHGTQCRAAGEVVHHTVILHLAERHEVGCAVIAYSRYRAAYDLQLVPIAVGCPVACGLGKEFVVVGEGVVHAVEEVLHVVADKAYALLSTEREAAQ